MINLVGLNGQPLQLNVNPNKYPLKKEGKSKSKIQYECGLVLKEKYPFAPILEEVRIPKHPFILDFFLPTHKLIVEVNGRQHDDFVPFFHKSYGKFVRGKFRDNDKAYWAELNNLRFISVSTPDELREIL